MNYLEKLFGLSGKTAIVTGGGRGIGQVVACGLAKAGAEVVIISRSGAEETVDLICRDRGRAYELRADVTEEEQVDRALDAGAKFIVSPGFNPEIVKYGISKGALMLPGTATPGEMQQAMNQGCEVVKFFPAEANGGVAMLKNIGAALKGAKWMCTGGVSAKNVNDYLGYSQIVAVGGTWMCKKELIEGEKWNEITAMCKEAVKTMLGFSLAHVGLNCENEAEAGQSAKTLCALFGFEYKPGNSSIFAGSAVECMKSPYLGKNGHIAIATNSLDRAVYHLGRQGVEFDESTRKPKAIYLKQEVGGFAIHLVQR